MAYADSYVNMKCMLTRTFVYDTGKENNLANNLRY